MKKFLLLIAISFSLSLFISSCQEDEDDGNNGGTDYAIATASWGKLTITLAETGGPTNEWYFASTGSSGMAALTGVDDFAFTYSKTGINESELVFTVGGSDKYEMTWTSATTGSFQESFNGTNGNPGTFSIVFD